MGELIEILTSKHSFNARNGFRTGVFFEIIQSSRRLIRETDFYSKAEQIVLQ